MQYNPVKYFNHRLAKSFVACSCEEPILVRTRTGRLLYAPCGQCPKCMQKRRSQWSKRLIDESQHPLCLHAFGFTLTWDSQHIPYIRLKQLEENALTYEMGFNGKPKLALNYGCEPHQFKLADEQNPAVSVLDDEQIQKLIHYFKKWLEQNEYADFEELEKPIFDNIHKCWITKKRTSPWLSCKYFIVGDYGDTHQKSENADEICTTTHRAHYHGIMYIYAKDSDIYEKIMNDCLLRTHVRMDCQTHLLRLWKGAKQQYDPRKGIYIGKSIQEFGKNWGDYLGKYVNKTMLSASARGSYYVPERVLCSHGLGLCWCEKENEYKRIMSELKMCVENHALFTPSYNDEKGKPHALPKAYKSYFIYKYFGVSPYDFNNWLYQRNRIRELIPVSRITEDPLELFPADVIEETYVVPPVFIMPKKKRERFSVYRMPDDCPIKKTKRIIFFKEFEEKAIALFNFLCEQTELYFQSFGDYSEDDEKLPCCWLDDCNQWYFEKSCEQSFVFHVKQQHDKVLNTCKQVREIALERKRLHEVHNGYRNANKC